MSLWIKAQNEDSSLSPLSLIDRWERLSKEVQIGNDLLSFLSTRSHAFGDDVKHLLFTKIYQKFSKESDTNSLFPIQFILQFLSRLQSLLD